MIELVRAGGKTPAELSREFECTAQTIINWVAQAARDEGRPLAGKEGLSSAEREELVRAAPAGAPASDGARYLGKGLRPWFAAKSDKTFTPSSSL